MNSLIIINAYPNNDYKISLLEQQLFYFRKMGLKIMVITGCDVPEKLRNQIDYLILNTDNIKVGKDHTYKCFTELSMGDTAFFFMMINSRGYGLYADHVNITIIKNIKLSFKMAEMLGYKSVFYTEDDNIFKERSFMFIKHNLNQINDGKYNLIGCKDNFSDADCIWTTYFFADIKFLLQKLTIPDTLEEYYNDNNILLYKLYKPLEVSFHEVLKYDLSTIKDIKSDISNLRSRGHVDDGKHSRGTSREWVLNNIINILPDRLKNTYLICHNTAFMLKSEQEREEFKNLTIDVYFDGEHKTQQNLHPCAAYYCYVSPNVKKIKVHVHGFFEKEYDADYESIKCSGIFI